MKNKVIVLDVDGVLLDCDNGFAYVASQALQKTVTRQNNLYDLRIRYGLTQEEVDVVWQEMMSHPQGWGGMPALPGAVAAFAALKNHGYEIHLVTAISETLRPLREECLAQHGIIPDGLHCAGSAWASKESIIRDLNPIFLVDDRLRHIEECPFVEHRVWVDHGDSQDGLEVHEDVYRVTSLSEWVKHWLSLNPRRREGPRQPLGPERAVSWRAIR